MMVVPVLLMLGLFAGAQVPQYEVYAVSYGTFRGFPLRSLVLGADSAARVDLSMMVWVLRGAGRVILVDAGFYRDEFHRSWKIEGYLRPSEAIAPLGIAPGDVTDIVISHFHWDHADGADLFPRARVWVQQAEYEHYRDSTNLPRSGVFAVDMAMLEQISKDGRLRLVPGDSNEVAPGVLVYTGGRHTKESQYVSVATRSGTVVIASDNAYLYQNLEQRRPIAATWDTVSNLRAQERMLRLASDARLVIPGHDLDVMSRFPAVAPGIVRIDSEPIAPEARTGRMNPAPAENSAGRMNPAPTAGDWPAWGRDAGSSKYSPLSVVNRSNVSRLQLAWEWRTGEKPITEPDSTRAVRPGVFQATPLAIGDTLYLSTPYNQVVALDGATGRELWRYDPEAWRYGQPPNGTGFVHRGVATWSDGRERRVFLNSRWRLIALDASTGRPIPDFGQGGEIDLTAELAWPVNRLHYTNTSPPIVFRDLVIVGNGVGDRLIYPNDPPGDVQAFDVKTGRRVWRWSPIPGPGELGHETWEDRSWQRTGHTNVWAPMSLDVQRGLLFLPVSTPSNDFYGGGRKGANLFAESLVCLDARTGVRRWHFQIVHHGVWDYDLPTAPILLTMRQDGREIPAVVQLTKQGFAFVFDRVTGAPVWPIEERPVPASDVPGERLWPTQPIPTRPAPFARQSFSEGDVVDFTPELERLAREVVRQYRMGPLYTPPSLQGTIFMPGIIGGAGWGGGAVDPETGTLYVKASNSPYLIRLHHPPHSDTVQAEISFDRSASLSWPKLSVEDSARLGGRPDGIPFNKPPYGTLTAIDLNSGEQRWQVVAGDSPEVRSHPLLARLSLPRLGASGAPGPLVTAGGLVFLTGGGPTLDAYDSRNGELLWSTDLGSAGYANPMTYATRDGRQFIAIATGRGAGAVLKVFALP